MKIENVVRLNGVILQDQSQSQLLNLVKVVQADKKELAKTFEGADMPASIRAQISAANDGLVAITTELDRRFYAENPTADRTAPAAAVGTASDLG